MACIFHLDYFSASEFSNRHFDPYRYCQQTAIYNFLTEEICRQYQTDDLVEELNSYIDWLWENHKLHYELIDTKHIEGIFNEFANQWTYPNKSKVFDKLVMEIGHEQISLNYHHL